MEQSTSPPGEITDCVYTRGLGTNLSLAATIPTNSCGLGRKIAFQASSAQNNTHIINQPQVLFLGTVTSSREDKM